MKTLKDTLTQTGNGKWVKPISCATTLTVISIVLAGSATVSVLVIGLFGTFLVSAFALGV